MVRSFNYYHLQTIKLHGLLLPAGFNAIRDDCKSVSCHRALMFTMNSKVCVFCAEAAYLPSLLVAFPAAVCCWFQRFSEGVPTSAQRLRDSSCCLMFPSDRVRAGQHTSQQVFNPVSVTTTAAAKTRRNTDRLWLIYVTAEVFHNNWFILSCIGGELQVNIKAVLITVKLTFTAGHKMSSAVHNPVITSLLVVFSSSLLHTRVVTYCFSMFMSHSFSLQSVFALKIEPH